MKVTSYPSLLPQGFKASGISAKIKKSGKKDLALFYSCAPCVASAMFTTNRIKAAPIKVSAAHLKSGSIQAVIVNSGNANCMTGEQGFKDALLMTQLAGRALGIGYKKILVSSTGIIGKPLPMDKIRSAIPGLVSQLSSRGLADAALGILTTDTFSKRVVKQFKIGNSEVTISGVTKGVGMVAPHLKSATMLAYILTDAAIGKSALDKALYEAVDGTFNSITVDGCMSTNDTVVVMANGLAGNKPIIHHSKEEAIFRAILKEVCLELAKMIIRDAEGATKFIEVKVKSAASLSEAKRLAFSIANSNLFKCAMFGSDPNWGRIAAALGSVPSTLDWQKLDISLNGRAVFRNGKPVLVKNSRFIKGKNVTVDISLNTGKAAASVYTSDLTYGYVRINADYN